MVFFVFLCTLCVLWDGVWGLSAERGEPPVSPKKPLEISSRELTYDRREGLTVFRGDVKVTHGAVTLTARELRAVSGSRFATAEGDVRVVDASQGVTLTCSHLEYRDFLGRMSAHGEPVLTGADEAGRPVTLRSRQMEYEAESGRATANQAVEIEHAEGRAWAQRAVYLRREGRLELEGEPRILTAYGEVSGRRLVLFLGEDRFVAEGAVESRLKPAEGR